MYQVLENWVGGFEGSSYNLYLSLLLLAIIGGLFFLIKGGDWLSEHSSHLAEILGVPQVIVGLTIVSIATSAPELFTSISALRSDSPSPTSRPNGLNSKDWGFWQTGKMNIVP